MVWSMINFSCSLDVYLKRLATAAVAVGLAAGLSACGSGAVSGDAVSSNTGTPTLAVTLTELNSTTARTSIGIGAPAKVNATFKTGTGAPIVGAVILFTTNPTLGTIDPAIGTALTDATGTASVTLNASTAAGAGTVTATGQTTLAGATTATTVTGSVSFTAAGAPTLTVTLTDPATNATRTSISAQSPARVNATFRTATGTPLVGAVITFTTNPILGVFNPSIGTALTDANGVAAILLNASTSTGAGTVTATAQTTLAGAAAPTTYTGSVNYTVGSTAGTPTLSVSLTDPATNAARTSITFGNPARVNATFRSATGAPIVGAIITFTTDPVLGVLTPSTGTALTDANGVASVTLSASSAAGAGTVTVSGQTTLAGATTPTTYTTSINYTVSSTLGSPTLTVALTELTSSAPRTSIASNSPARVTATFRSATGTPIAGAVVTFTTNPLLGVFDPTTGTALTDANGVASVTLSASTASGAGTVTATAQTTLAGNTTPTTFTNSVSYSAGGIPSIGPATLSVVLTDVTSNNPRTTIAFGNPGRVSATFRTAQGAPIVGAVILFSTNATLGVFDPALGTALTDSNGVASVLLNSATATGAGTVTATGQTTLAGQTTATTYTATVNYSVTAVASPPSFVVTLTDPTTNAPRTSVSPQDPARVSATFRTGTGTAVVGAVVSFATTGTIGTFVPANGTAVTDSAGVASVLLYPSTSSGGATVTATSQTVVSGSSAPVSVTGSIGYTSTAAPGITMNLTDPTTGAQRTSISSGSPARVTAVLRETTGAPSVGTVVTFATNATFGVFSPASGTALTDATGAASVLLNPASITASGAATVTASAQIGTGTSTTPVTSSVGYTVGSANVTLSPVTIQTPLLSAYGTTNVSVTASVGGVVTSTPLTVNFTSPCISSGKATITTPVTTVNGVATTTYRDNGCASVDTITASVTGLSASSTGTLTVTAPAIGSIQFVSARPTSIALRGTGGAGRQESSLVSFRLVDVAGNPIGGSTVNFTLTTSIGGLAVLPTSAVSDPATGVVSTTVQAGSISTPVRVNATTTVGSQMLSTQSDQLSLSTGVATQDGFSLSVSSFNIEGGSIDGIPSIITAALTDRYRNPVPDGVVVNFTASGGSIVSTCTTVKGACSSTLTSQNFRPTNGRINVLAYAIGEESFTDTNGNGWFDLGETFVDMPDAFVDTNENGRWDSGEPFFKFDNSQSTYSSGDGRYNGVSCNESIAGGSSAGSCSPVKGIYARGNTTIVFSGSTPDFVRYAAPADLIFDACPEGAAPPAARFDATSKKAIFIVRDTNDHLLPAGTTVSFTATNGKIVSDPTSFTIPSNNAKAPSVEGLDTFTVTMTSDASQTSILNSTTGALQSYACTNASREGNLTMTVKTPSGRVTTRSILVKD
jgi:hypothetical protein